MVQVLVNRYADGEAGIKWHSDDEKCYGDASNILIASVSLGTALVLPLQALAWS